MAEPQDGGIEDGADAQRPKRYIPKEVVSKLLEDARHGCCVCRVLIDPQRFDSEAQFGSLEKHHIIYFSEGGGNTCDNLLLVCANCHAQAGLMQEKSGLLSGLLLSSLWLPTCF